MRHKVDTLTRTVLQFAGAMMMLVVIAFFASTASAQDAIDVQQDLDIATVNSKAEDAKGRAMGVEGRLTTAEGTIATHGAEVSAIATGQQTLESRVATLEAAPPPPPSNEAQVNSNTARIATLESQTAPTVTKYVVRDSLGTFVDDWEDRSSVGTGSVQLASGKQLKVEVTPSKLVFLPKFPAGTVYELPDCSNTIGKVFVIFTDDRKPGWQNEPNPLSFDNAIEGVLMENALYVPNWASPFRVGIIPLYVRLMNVDGTFQCNPRAQWDGGQLLPMQWEADLPTFTPPFTVAEE